MNERTETGNISLNLKGMKQSKTWNISLSMKGVNEKAKIWNVSYE